MKSNALVVVDMQNDFITGSLANPAADQIVPAIVDEILSGKYDTIYVTMDTHDDDYLETVEGKHLPIKHCIRDTAGWRLDSRIQRALQVAEDHDVDVIPICKRGFGSRLLCDTILYGFTPATITLVGTCTDICVISNALILKTLEITEVNVIADLCAGTTKENHDAAIQVMRQCHVNIL